MNRKVTIVILAIAVAAVSYGVYKYKIQSRNAVDLLASKNQLINVLIAGGNKFNDHRHRFYAIATINPANNRVGVTFIPPEFELDLEDDGNAVRIATADIRDFDQISEALQKSLKIKVQFYVVIYPPDVRKAVDLVEGLSLYVMDNAKGISGMKLGENYFDGYKTVQYINQNAGSIFSKYDRVQDILFTLYDKKNAYAKYLTLDTIIECRKNIKTNIMPQEFISMMNLLMKDGDMLCTVLPGLFSAEGNYYMDEVALKKYEENYLKKLVLNEKEELNVRVRILNGTGVSGLAKKTRNSLMREGISVVEFGNSSYETLEKSVVINNSGNAKTIRTLAEITGITQIHNIIDNTQLYSATIIIGKDMIKQ